MKQLYACVAGAALLLVGLLLYHNSSDSISHIPAMQASLVHPANPGQTDASRNVVRFRPLLPRPNHNQLRNGTNTTAVTTNFTTLLLQTANGDQLVYLSSVDSAYLQLAVNLYESSYRRLGILNYIFACSDEDADKALQARGINSIQYIGDKSSHTVSNYGTHDFRRKTHLKTKIILEALLLGLTVIIVDVDIIFFKDPVPYLDCTDCDIQIQSDVVEGNSGFYMVRPTKASIDLHKKAWDIALKQGESISNQKVLDRNMESMQKSGQMKVTTLDRHKFPSGFVYFEEKHRMFYWDNPPTQEVILHNNWIVSMEAKRYRFKELLLWYVDIDGYYSNPAARYLAYDNPHDFGATYILEIETNALMAAFIIGHILNRTVILPTFTCHSCSYGACKVPSKQCTLNTHYKVATLDAVWGEGNYREHVFLDNPAVPQIIRTDSPTYLIHRPQGTHQLPQLPTGVELRTPASIEAGPTVDEVRNWFSANTEPVLRFHSLYNVLGSLRADGTFATIQKAIKMATDYRQY